MENFLDKIQNSIDRHLNSCPEFRTIPVISYKQSCSSPCLEEFSIMGTGICIIVCNPIPIKINSSSEKIAFEEFLIRVQIMEYTYSNDTGFSTLWVAEQISKRLHKYRPNVKEWSGWLNIVETTPWSEIRDTENLGRYILEIQFVAKGTLSEAV
jgi:hypothetical protein